MSDEYIIGGGSSRCAKRLAGIGAWFLAACSAFGIAPAGAAEPSKALLAEWKAVVGKQVWYAPHAGCLDRLRVRIVEGKSTRWQRRYPERETLLQIKELVRIDGRWMFRFDGPDGGGLTPADRVVADMRFQPLPTTFYQTCFFVEQPKALAGYLQAEYPQALQRYDGPSAADRQREISAIESRDRQGNR